jgi:hypothetical protein
VKTSIRIQVIRGEFVQRALLDNQDASTNQQFQRFQFGTDREGHTTAPGRICFLTRWSGQSQSAFVSAPVFIVIRFGDFTSVRAVFDLLSVLHHWGAADYALLNVNLPQMA